MKKQHRLRKTKDFSAAYHQGKHRANPTLVLIAHQTHNPHTRFGFSVSKKIGNAVTRNRIKRQLKETARTNHLPRLQPGWDIVIIARKNAAAANHQQLKQSLRQLFKRAKIPTQPAPANRPAQPDNHTQPQPTQPD